MQLTKSEQRFVDNQRAAFSRLRNQSLTTMDASSAAVITERRASAGQESQAGHFDGLRVYGVASIAGYGLDYSEQQPGLRRMYDSDCVFQTGGNIPLQKGHDLTGAEIYAENLKFSGSGDELLFRSDSIVRNAAGKRLVDHFQRYRSNTKLLCSLASKPLKYWIEDREDGGQTQHITDCEILHVSLMFPEECGPYSGRGARHPLACAFVSDVIAN